MAATTHLEPLTSERADDLFALFAKAAADESKAIALDSDGRATGLVDVESRSEEHLLGDLDVHA